MTKICSVIFLTYDKTAVFFMKNIQTKIFPFSMVNFAKNTKKEILTDRNFCGAKTSFILFYLYLKDCIILVQQSMDNILTSFI